MIFLLRIHRRVNGFHGVARPAFPDGVLTFYERTYPFAWLGILAEAPPTRDELCTCTMSVASPSTACVHRKKTRLYLQCPPHEDIREWSDERIWDELDSSGCAAATATPGWCPGRGKILQKGVTGMRSFVAEPLQFGRLFLAGDTAHIVPPTGAKGMNLAFADVYYLAEALRLLYCENDAAGLNGYSTKCLRRIWRAQRFSWWILPCCIASMMSRPLIPGGN